MTETPDDIYHKAPQGMPSRRRRSRRSGGGGTLRPSSIKRPQGRGRFNVLVVISLFAVLIFYVAGIAIVVQIKKKRTADAEAQQNSQTTTAATAPNPTAPLPVSPPADTSGWENDIALWRDAIRFVQRMDKLPVTLGAETAAEKMREQLTKTPYLLPVKLALAKQLVSAGHHEQAVAAAREILVIDPSHREARMMLARSLAQTRQHDSAIVVARWILDEEPYSNESRAILADAFLAINKPLNAVPFLERLVESDALNHTARNNLGIAYSRIGEHERASKVFEGAMLLNPNNSLAYFNLAASYAQQARVADSVDVLRRAAERFGADFVHSWMQGREFNPIRSTLPFERLLSEVAPGSPPPKSLPAPLPNDRIEDASILPPS